MTGRLHQIFPELGIRPLVMGILNVTPDSFSDGGRFITESDLLRQSEQLISDGADLLDIGGESTRPGAREVPAEEESARVTAAVAAIRRRFRIPLSVDTTKAAVARQALSAGADIVNDISALRFDPAMVAALLEYRAPLIMMHMQGTPRDMQDDPTYRYVIGEIYAFLAERLEWATAQGLDRHDLVVDPGLGFGKTAAHNLTILKHLNRFTDLGCPVLIGHSRKSFIGKILDCGIDARDPATAILSGICAMHGAAFLRVHDVAATVQAVRLATAVMQASD